MRNLLFLVLFFVAFLAVVEAQQLDTTAIPLQYRVCTGCSPSEGVDNLSGEYSYGELITYQSRDVTSDFGARYLTTYDWHKGVDFRPLPFAGSLDGGRGTVVVAADTGRIEFVSGNSGFKYIVVEGNNYHFGYGHVFNSRNPNTNNMVSGKFLLARIAIPMFPARYAVVDLQHNVAYGAIEGEIVIVNGDTLTVQRQINRGEDLAPMGGSGGGSYRDNDPFDVHLHLYQFESVSSFPYIINSYETNCLDPLHVISHQDTDYDVRIGAPENLTNNSGTLFDSIKLFYPGTVQNKFHVRPIMEGATNTNGEVLGEDIGSSRYGNVVMNIDCVSVQVKNCLMDSVFHPIAGKEHPSVIAHGAINDSIMYPRYIALDGRDGKWSRQGIDPSAYNGAIGYPYDDFYFTDFITRIHRDDPMDGGDAMIAYCPMDARYNDGPYELYAEVKNVRDSAFYSDTLAFNLDNWKPFVQQAEFRRGNQLLYRRGWDCKTEEECRGVAISTPYEPDEFNYLQETSVLPWTITATMSEPMGNLSLDILGMLASGGAEIAIEDIQATWDESRMIATFQVTTLATNGQDLASYFSSNSPYEGIQFAFYGYDMAEPANNLIAFNFNHTGQSCITLPTRGTDGWENDNLPDGGADLVHFTRAACAGNRNNRSSDPVFFFAANPEDCHVVNGTVTGYNGPGELGAIALSVDGLLNFNYDYQWSNGDTMATVTDLEPGVYKVTVSDGLCCEVVEAFVVGDCSLLVIEVNANVTLPSSCTANDGVIRLLGGSRINGGTAPYVFHLERNGQFFTDQNIGQQSNLSPARYCYVVTDANGCRAEECVDLIFEGMPIALYAGGTPACSENSASGSAEIIMDIEIGGNENYTFTWSNGYAETGLYSLNEGLLPGNYFVTVTSSVNPGCPIVESITVSSLDISPPPINYGASLIQPCPNSSNGAIRLTIFGGEPPYVIEWDNGQTGHFNEDIQNGQHCFKITDRCGQTLEGCEVMESLSVVVEVEPGCGSGHLTATPISGNPPFNFSWSDIAQSGPSINVNSGSFDLLVSDRNGCSFVVEDITITNHDISLESTAGSCNGLNEGTAVFTGNNPDALPFTILIDENEFLLGGDFSSQFAFEIPNLNGEQSHLIQI